MVKMSPASGSGGQGDRSMNGFQHGNSIEGNYLDPETPSEDESDSSTESTEEIPQDEDHLEDNIDETEDEVSEAAAILASISTRGAQDQSSRAPHRTSPINTSGSFVTINVHHPTPDTSGIPPVLQSQSGQPAASVLSTPSTSAPPLGQGTAGATLRLRPKGRPKNPHGRKPNPQRIAHANEAVRNAIQYPITGSDLERLLWPLGWDVERAVDTWLNAPETAPIRSRSVVEVRRNLMVELFNRLNAGRAQGSMVGSWMDMEILLRTHNWDVDQAEEASDSYGNLQEFLRGQRRDYQHLRLPNPTQFLEDERLAYILGFMGAEDDSMVGTARDWLRLANWNVAAAIRAFVLAGPEAQTEGFQDAEIDGPVNAKDAMPGADPSSSYATIKNGGRTFWIVNENRSKANLKFPDSSKLRLVRFKEGQFNNVMYDKVVDWQNKEDVGLLNNWRSQRFRRATGKTVKEEGIPYHKEENEWLYDWMATEFERQSHETPEAVRDGVLHINWHRLQDEFNTHFQAQTLGTDPRPRPTRAWGSLYAQVHRHPEIIRDFNFRHMPAHPSRVQRSQQAIQQASDHEASNAEDGSPTAGATNIAGELQESGELSDSKRSHPDSDDEVETAGSSKREKDRGTEGR